MEKRKFISSERAVLSTKDPEIQLLVIELLKAHSIQVHSDTTEYDPRFPYLVWDYNDLTQTKMCLPEEARDLKQFLSIFFVDTVKIQLTKEYEAVVGKEEVKVGCQTIPFGKLEEVYNTVKKLREE